VIDYAGKGYFLSVEGISTNEKEAIIADEKLINSIVFKASNNSVYAVNEQLKQGFITAYGGIRIGICGELVIENGQIITIRNFSSINIRIPHEVKNCSLPALKFLTSDKGDVLNTLVISPPGAGKTTFLRDLIENIGIRSESKKHNLLVLDERYEIAASVQGRNMLSVGKFSDVISGATKEFGFREGIRAMRPDIIFCDELALEDDIKAVSLASSSGVVVVSTVHAKDLTELKKKSVFKNILEEGVFKRFIVLSRVNGPGTYDAIYDENFSLLYLR